LDFELPAELIAQSPAGDRAASRLLHYRRGDQSITHRTFSDLPSLLRAGDLLVFNNAKVIPARFMLLKSTGGKVEGLFLKETRPGRWEVLLRNFGRGGGSLRFAADPAILATPVRFGEGGLYEIDVHSDESAVDLLNRLGRMPLPPYIKRGKESDERDERDRERYQTVFARESGSVAAPTAGLHFSETVFADLAQHGVERTFVTLHVGLGTFKPVMSETLEGHAMHTEAYSIDAGAADSLNRARREGRRIIAVGTTAARVLESPPGGEIVARSGETNIFIYPPYAWKHVDALVTNFHLPRSTLIALVAAMVGIEEQRRIYQEAIAERYRFFSYGDAMFVD
jgi:S-adenosylmethionine:tRNA ribosyltransferase-isomerase